MPAVLLILSYEQLRLVPYRDAVGVATWGWGHAQAPGEKVPSGAITREWANALFIADLDSKERAVVKALGPSVTSLTDYQFGACVSLAFNIGAGAFAASTLCRLIRDGRLQRVPPEFDKWVKGTVDGKKVTLRGLVERRAAERRMWESGWVLPSAPETVTA